MIRSIWLILIGKFFPSYALSKSLTYQTHYDKAEQMISEGHFEDAINYLTAQSRREDLIDVDRLYIAISAAFQIFQYGDKNQAIFVIKPIHDELVKKYGAKYPASTMARKALIQAYLKCSEHNNALECANIAIQSAPTKQDLAQAYVTLGDVYREAAEYSKSIKYYLEAEQLFIELGGKERHSADLDVLYNNLAMTYSKTRDFDNSLKIYQQALNINDEDDPRYYRTLSGMAYIYRSIGQVDKAKDYFIKIADYYLKIEGVNSFTSIQKVNEIGLIEMECGHYNDALIHYKKVLDYGERLGYDEIKAIALKSMGSAYHHLDDDNLALSHLEKAQVIYQKLPLHIESANNYEELALVASKQKLFVKELDFYDQSLAIRKLLHLENEPDYAQILTKKAMAYQAQREYAQADTIYQQSLTLLKKVQPQGERMLYLLVNLAALRVAQKNNSEADAILIEAIDILELSLSENHPKIASANNDIASVYSLMDQKKSAVEYYQKAIDISTETNGPNHSSTKIYVRNLRLAEERNS